MPEGPEIRRAADQVGKALVGRRVNRVEFAFEHLRGFESQLRDRLVERVESRGKAILTYFDNDWVIYSHNQLYGKWYLARPGCRPETGRQLRLAIENRDSSALLYSASDIDVIRRPELDQHPFLARLGPDILSQQPSIGSIVERLACPRFRDRQLASLLLDQSFLAGLGNYLRAEILTVSGLHPTLKPAECSQPQLRRLALQILRITRRAYRTGGVTNPPGLVARLKSAGLTRHEEYRFNTYGRNGQRCHYCGGEIEFSHAGGRKMYFCPVCQPAPEPK